MVRIQNVITYLLKKSYINFFPLTLAGHGSEIINGKNVPQNSMQYMASVQINGKHVCGGFLVSEDFVLTAAHCYKK